METTKREYTPPKLIVVDFKAERGYAFSGIVDPAMDEIEQLNLLFQIDGAPAEQQERFDMTQQWTGGGYFTDGDSFF